MVRDEVVYCNWFLESWFVNVMLIREVFFVIKVRKVIIKLKF